ncbi:MAG: hypothetical protein SV377_02170 [Halobacteria archaeon]|nr:hypothetical protein [Halobacteria archaeon]
MGEIALGQHFDATANAPEVPFQILTLTLVTTEGIGMLAGHPVRLIDHQM